MCFYKSYDWWTWVITQYMISLQIIIFKSQNTVKSPAEYIQVPGFMSECLRHWFFPKTYIALTGSYDVAKNVIVCIWCNAMSVCGLRSNNHIISHILYIIVAPPFWNALICTKLIVLRSEVCSDWPAIQCVVIGRIAQACNANFTPLTGATRQKQ